MNSLMGSGDQAAGQYGSFFTMRPVAKFNRLDYGVFLAGLRGMPAKRRCLRKADRMTRERKYKALLQQKKL